ncbi:hypothetical protein O181_011320 [Austropuccinia psidii MF-1]|uniref:Uncharacterized protein n=1 Tax=Austropuccinia psidii MF-1 TaxID=1389203 RepID=A0A9Q3BUX3_9BASI|nr:hypothetical protein [Austropuccinia psidii MF-1]
MLVRFVSACAAQMHTISSLGYPAWLQLNHTPKRRKKLGRVWPISSTLSPSQPLLCESSLPAELRSFSF